MHVMFDTLGIIQLLKYNNFIRQKKLKTPFSL